MGATPAVFSFQGMISAIIASPLAGASYFFENSVKTDGATATLIGGQFTSVQEDAALSTAVVNITVSGNNLIINLTGIAATTIHWKAYLTYIEVT